MAERPGDAPPFCVLLGPDYAGKSTAMSALAEAPSPWRLISVDDAFLGPDHRLIARLRRDLVTETLPALGTAYSPDFAATLMQTAVVHLRDQIIGSRGPVLVDSYYYKILAKCRLLGAGESPLFAWWRSLPQPARVLYLDVPPATAWRRSGDGADLNPLEHYGDRPEQAAFAAYQADLRKLMLEEIRHLPVSVIDARDTAERTVRAIREVLADEWG
jgi:thymidylate kinase